MNILITSAGNKVPLIECLKATTGKKVIAADVNENCLAKYFSDGFVVMERLESIRIDSLIKVCEELEVKYVLPTRDEDSLFFAKHQATFNKHGICLFTTSSDSLEVVNDKLKFYLELSSLGFPVIPTFKNPDDVVNASSYVVKEQFGSGSKKIFLNITKEKLKEKGLLLNQPIYQPLINGKEYSIDLYVTKNHVVKSLIVRERNLIIDGEAQISTIVEHKKIETLIKKVAEVLKLSGHVMFQVIEDQNDDIWIIECNARVGGASTLSIYAGLDSFNWWMMEFENVDVLEIPTTIKKLKQIRYKKDLII